MNNTEVKNLLETAISLHSKILKSERDKVKKEYYKGLIDGIEFALKQISVNK